MSDEKSKEQIQTERDERIKDLKIEIFEIIRQQEGLTYQVNQLQEAKKQRNEQLQILELEKMKESQTADK